MQAQEAVAPAPSHECSPEQGLAGPGRVAASAETQPRSPDSENASGDLQGRVG